MFVGYCLLVVVDCCCLRSVDGCLFVVVFLLNGVCCL